MMQTLQKNTSSIAISALLAMGVASSSLPFAQMPAFEKVSMKEVTTTPMISQYAKKNWVQESKSLFAGARDFSAEEKQLYEDSLVELFQPTGRNFFDL